jgi:hypothetical protein
VPTNTAPNAETTNVVSLAAQSRAIDEKRANAKKTNLDPTKLDDAQAIIAAADPDRVAREGYGGKEQTAMSTIAKARTDGKPNGPSVDERKQAREAEKAARQAKREVEKAERDAKQAEQKQKREAEKQKRDAEKKARQTSGERDSRPAYTDEQTRILQGKPGYATFAILPGGILHPVGIFPGADRTTMAASARQAYRDMKRPKGWPSVETVEFYSVRPTHARITPGLPVAETSPAPAITPSGGPAGDGNAS